MNSVSWFLYFIDVFDNVRVGFQIVAFISFLGVLFLFIGVAITEGEISEDALAIKRALKVTLAVGGISFLVLMPIPSKNTLYAIAASEVGEKIVKNESVQEITSDATKALHQWIKKQIEPEKK